ncbi:MAG: hypothetical protein JWL90_375 [Chthoniobacteraceae bacterium]|nr:hypothetical protein [Chthoniobacteraceae bacterium]
MHILITQSGGFAGLVQRVADVDTHLLDAAKAQKIEALVQSTQFFKLPPRVAGDAKGADFQIYEITITENGHSYRVEFLDDQSAATCPLRRLVDLVVD